MKAFLLLLLISAFSYAKEECKISKKGEELVATGYCGDPFASYKLDIFPKSAALFLTTVFEEYESFSLYREEKGKLRQIYSAEDVGKPSFIKWNGSHFLLINEKPMTPNPIYNPPLSSCLPDQKFYQDLYDNSSKFLNRSLKWTDGADMEITYALRLHDPPGRLMKITPEGNVTNASPEDSQSFFSWQRSILSKHFKNSKEQKCINFLSRFADPTEKCVLDNNLILGVSGSVLATFDDNGKLSPAKTQCKFSSQAPNLLENKLNLIGLENGKETVVLAKAITKPKCGDAVLDICLENYWPCHYPEINFFMTPVPGQKLFKINSPGLMEQVSEKTWLQMENSLRQIISTGYETGYGISKGVPKKRIYRSVQKVSVTGNPNLKLGIIGMESTEDDTSVSKVYLLSLISGQDIVPTSKPLVLEFFHVARDIEKNILAVQNGDRVFLILRHYLTDQILSLDSKGEVISELKIANGKETECERSLPDPGLFD